MKVFQEGFPLTFIAESFDTKHVSFVSVGGGGVRVEQGHLRPLCPAQRPGPSRVLCSLVRPLQGMDVAKKIINKKQLFINKLAKKLLEHKALFWDQTKPCKNGLLFHAFQSDEI